MGRGNASQRRVRDTAIILTDRQLIIIIQLLRSGFSIRRISREFGIDEHTLREIRDQLF
ncbi:DNA-binding NarL/FixJ family response regulator [Peribacillus deserti]|uniref:DNA-binding NarL/FixJ family response regulator n=1 Tax=Peribacillus deserti TaxID=673318 RepID=A0ABS2QLW6_9BACI|nr:helix-turn-helix domain-containing protein [Peribacillus deserti]MBM7693709.1 DNA-binding NarL/FixJ family response regulator [Peribacillus deserti]